MLIHIQHIYNIVTITVTFLQLIDNYVISLVHNSNNDLFRLTKN